MRSFEDIVPKAISIYNGTLQLEVVNGTLIIYLGGVKIFSERVSKPIRITSLNDALPYLIQHDASELTRDSMIDLSSIPRLLTFEDIEDAVKGLFILHYWILEPSDYSKIKSDKDSGIRQMTAASRGGKVALEP
ncbi:unnamed protein product [Gordionus sp. m RMFG-2023]